MNDTEGLCSRWSPEASRDLEFDLRHAHLALGFVVCEGNPRVPSEAQDTSAPSCSRRKRLTVSVWRVGPG